MSIYRLLLGFVLSGSISGLHAAPGDSGVHKLNDVVVYEDPQFYSAFPSIVQRRNGELLVAFRRAPERRPYDPSGVTHTDANSNLVLVRSKDDGKTWTKNPELISVHPFGGSQDPCMIQLRDGTLLCASYTWAPVPAAAIAKLKQPVMSYGNFAFLGGYLVRSRDAGKTWSDPIFPAPRLHEPNVDIFGKPIPAYNRGAMCEGRDGRIYWVVASGLTNASTRTGNHLMISSDKGETWQYSCVVAEDPKIQFNEASIYETPKGDLVAFLRTAGFNDHTCIARSTDRGRSFTWKDAGFQGHPHYALQLPDKRVLLVYGYRHKPFGIRARILDPECTNTATAEEIVLRDDGGNGDLGYPWATMVSKDRALVVYYFNKDNGTRQIGGTFVKIK